MNFLLVGGAVWINPTLRVLMLTLFFNSSSGLIITKTHCISLLRQQYFTGNECLVVTYDLFMSCVLHKNSDETGACDAHYPAC